MSPRKQIERTLVDNIFQSIEIIVSEVQTALQKEVVALFPNHTSPADKIVVDKRLILSCLSCWGGFYFCRSQHGSHHKNPLLAVLWKKKQTACSLGSLIINSTLATFEMAQTLSLSIINVLYCNQRGSWFWDQISLQWPCACGCPPPPPLLWAHLLSRESDLGPWPTLLHHRGLMLLDCPGRRKVEKAHAVHLAFVWSRVHFQGDRENK